MAEVLLIDAEQPFAGEMKASLEGRGFSVTQLDDGKEGLEYARTSKPDLIVLCVELPKMSGYSICNKLKKDGDLKQIPLIITSSEATPETFAQHKKLKTRAEDYLIKPFEVTALMEKIGGQIPLPEPGAGGGASDEEDLAGALGALDAIGEDEVQLDESALDDLKIESAEEVAADAPRHVDAMDGEESLDLGELGATDGLLDGLDGSLGGGLDDGGDDLLAGLDGALSEGGLSEGSLSEGSLSKGSMGESGLDDGGDDLLAGLDDNLGGGLDEGGGLGGDLDDGFGDLEGGADEALDATTSAPSDDALPDFDAAFEEISPEPEKPAPAVESKKPAPKPAVAASPQAAAVAATSAADLAAMNALRRETTELKAQVSELEAKLKAAEELARSSREAAESAKSGSSSSARETLELKKEIRSKDKELMELKDQIFQKEEAVVELQEELDRVKGESDAAIAGAAEKDAEIAKLGAKVQALTEERDALEAEVQSRLHAVEAENASLKGELDGVRGELEEARGDLDKVRSEGESKVQDLERRLRSVEQENKDTSEQLVEAYQRIKSEEGLRDKAKDALSIAMALLSGEVEDSSSASSLEHSLDA